MRHNCNAYCNDIEHCDLVFSQATNPATVEQHMWWAYKYNYGVTVTRVEPAREAPGLDSFRPQDIDRLTGGPPTDAARWLVWYAKEGSEG